MGEPDVRPPFTAYRFCLDARRTETEKHDVLVDAHPAPVQPSQGAQSQSSASTLALKAKIVAVWRVRLGLTVAAVRMSEIEHSRESPAGSFTRLPSEALPASRFTPAPSLVLPAPECERPPSESACHCFKF